MIWALIVFGLFVIIGAFVAGFLISFGAGGYLGEIYNPPKVGFPVYPEQTPPREAPKAKKYYMLVGSHKVEIEESEVKAQEKRGYKVIYE